MKTQKFSSKRANFTQDFIFSDFNPDLLQIVCLPLLAAMGITPTLDGVMSSTALTNFTVITVTPLLRSLILLFNQYGIEKEVWGKKMLKYLKRVEFTW